MERRTVSQSRSYYPSWSWCGWAGQIGPSSWNSSPDFLQVDDIELYLETLPITTWYTGLSRPGRLIGKELLDYKNLYQDPAYPLSDGWTRHISTLWVLQSQFDRKPVLERSQPYFYTHESNPKRRFWYPIPIRKPAEPLIRGGSLTYLFSVVQTIDCLSLDKDSFGPMGSLVYESLSLSLKDDEGSWAGVLRPHHVNDIIGVGSVQLIAISSGRCRQHGIYMGDLEEWDMHERPKTGVWYEFYNVLWIEWSEGIAYRKGIGRVWKDMWDRQNPKEIDITLG
jgi:hypothetical protein